MNKNKLNTISDIIDITSDEVEILKDIIYYLDNNLVHISIIEFYRWCISKKYVSFINEYYFIIFPLLEEHNEEFAL